MIFFFSLAQEHQIHYFLPLTMMYLRLRTFLFFSSTLAVSNGLSASPPTKYYGGAGVGRLILDGSSAEAGGAACHYDMVLVERIQGRPKTDSGLFVPDEDLPKLHLCKGTCVLCIMHNS
jgi:hypothetical protein